MVVTENPNDSCEQQIVTTINQLLETSTVDEFTGLPVVDLDEVPFPTTTELKLIRRQFNLHLDFPTDVLPYVPEKPPLENGNTTPYCSYYKSKWHESCSNQAYPKLNLPTIHKETILRVVDHWSIVSQEREELLVFENQEVLFKPEGEFTGYWNGYITTPPIVAILKKGGRTGYLIQKKRNPQHQHIPAVVFPVFKASFTITENETNGGITRYEFNNLQT